MFIFKRIDRQMEQTKRYTELSAYLRQRFPNFKVQKISINAGFTCPNRDGTKGWGGLLPTDGERQRAT